MKTEFILNICGFFCLIFGIILLFFIGELVPKVILGIGLGFFVSVFIVLGNKDASVEESA